MTDHRAGVFVRVEGQCHGARAFLIGRGRRCRFRGRVESGDSKGDLSEPFSQMGSAGARVSHIISAARLGEVKQPSNEDFFGFDWHTNASRLESGLEFRAGTRAQERTNGRQTFLRKDGRDITG